MASANDEVSHLTSDMCWQELLAHAIRHDLLIGLEHCFNDPGDDITQWFVEGAPAGVMPNFALDKTLEKTADSQPCQQGDSSTDYDQAAKYHI
eukprot:1232550-Amphidinium_carterae.1